MKFESYIPCDRLKPFIRSFSISEVREESIYKVLPGTGLVIGFQFKGKLVHIDNNVEIPLSAAGITGLHDSYRIFKNSEDTGTVLIYFKEGGASAFFKEPVHELFSESVSLDNFMLRSELLVLEERLCEAQKDTERISIVEQFLVSRMCRKYPDQLVIAALAVINKNNGNIRIKELAASLNTSQSPLEKRFRRVIGASPKKFASIVRLRHTLQIYDPHRSFTELGYDAGFYDQSHFIKEFRRFTGETPEDFFSER